MRTNIFTPALISAFVIGLSGLLANTASAQTKTTTVHHTVVSKTTVVKKTITKKPSAADLAAGKGLMAKSDCLGCHKLDVKLVGPAYYDVAKKYSPTEANYELLTNKVLNGGSGVWGAIPMAAHPALSHDDAKKIVKYILSLKPGQS